MSHSSGSIMVHRPQLTLLDKTATLSSWLFAAAVFMTVGWFALEPDDPQGAVSIFTRSGALMMMVQAAALAAVTAGVATVIAGRRLADVGTFAAAIGLALVSLRGNTATYLLLQGVERSPGFERSLAIKFTAEALVWFAVVVVALGVSAVVMQWCFGRVERSGHSASDLRSIASGAMAGFDVPQVGEKLFGVPVGQQTPPREGLKHTAITAVAAIAAMTLLSSGLATRSIQHGQACFVVAAAVAIASYVAHRLVPVRSALWSILGVVVLALAAYVWACVRPAATGSPVSVPSSHFLRVLPIQYISVGTAAAIAMFWSHHVPPQASGSGLGGDPRGLKSAAHSQKGGD